MADVFIVGPVLGGRIYLCGGKKFSPGKGAAFSKHFVWRKNSHRERHGNRNTQTRRLHADPSGNNNTDGNTPPDICFRRDLCGRGEFSGAALAFAIAYNAFFAQMSEVISAG